MSLKPAISASNLSKAYPLFDRPWERMRHLLMGQRSPREFKALSGVSFEVAQGESVGIIGRNGSGKSTLLQLIAGTLTPSRGEVQVYGRVAALLELGSGFNPEFTGRENVYLNGAIMGCGRAQMNGLFDEIAAFADIGEFIDQAVKEYSSGMQMRLAFAVQVAIRPDILIVDEALSVGDFFFQQKCLRRIRELKEQGTTLLFVSHDMGVVRDLCDRVLFLQRGELVFEGETHVGIRHYLNDKAGEPTARAAAVLDTPPPMAALGGELAGYMNRAIWRASDPNASGARILCVVVEDAMGKPGLTARIGDTLKFSVVYRVAENALVHPAIVLKNRYDQIVNCTSTYTLGMEMPAFRAGEVAVMELELSMMLEAGQYTFFSNLGLIGAQANRGESIDETPWLGPISIGWEFEAEPAPFLGMFGVPAAATIRPLQDSAVGVAGR